MKTLADAHDSFVTWVVLYFFLWSISLAMEASAYLVGARIGHNLTEWANVPVGLGFLALLLAAVVYSRRRGKIDLRNTIRSLPDNYVTETIRQSTLVAFVATVTLVAVLDHVAVDTALPAGFFIKLSGFCLLAAFSVSFFFLNRHSTDSESD